VTPVVYTYFDQFGRWMQNRGKAKESGAGSGGREEAPPVLRTPPGQTPAAASVMAQVRQAP
jgi:hypothetical protein